MVIGQDSLMLIWFGKLVFGDCRFVALGYQAGETGHNPSVTPRALTGVGEQGLTHPYPLHPGTESLISECEQCVLATALQSISTIQQITLIL